MNAAVFLDKDGTLIRDVPYNVDISRIEIMPHAIEALRQFQDQGYLLIIVSNQSGVSRGYFGREELQSVSSHLAAVFQRHAITLRAFYYCPHAEGCCTCRKPLPGLFFRAARDYNIDLSASWMIGDILNDVEAGRRAGCRTILLDNGNETEWRMNGLRTPDYRVKDLEAAAAAVVPQKQAYAPRNRQV